MFNLYTVITALLNASHTMLDGYQEHGNERLEDACGLLHDTINDCLDYAPAYE